MLNAYFCSSVTPVKPLVKSWLQYILSNQSKGNGGTNGDNKPGILVLSQTFAIEQYTEQNRERDIAFANAGRDSDWNMRRADGEKNPRGIVKNAYGKSKLPWLLQIAHDHFNPALRDYNRQSKNRHKSAGEPINQQRISGARTNAD